MKSIFLDTQRNYMPGEANADLLVNGNRSAKSHNLTTILDSIPAMIGYIDCNMVLQFCNQSFKNWFRIEGEASGQTFPAIAGRAIFDQVQRHLGKVLVGESAHFEISANIQNGPQYLEAILSPDFDASKKVKGFIVQCSDVTEKYRTERTLKDYFENASIGLHWVNADGIIIWANLAELKMLGYTEKEYIGRNISEFHVNKIAIDDIMSRLNKKQRITNYDADLVCKDGSVKHVTINSSGLWEDDKFIHTRCFTIDVTEQKMAVKAVQESEDRLRKIASLVPLVIWTADEKGDCNFLSMKWEQLTGRPPGEGMGKLWTNFIHPEDRDKVISSWSSSLSSVKAFEGKFRFLNASGDYIIVFMNSSPIYDDTGKVTGYIGIFQDISAEEQVKYSLEKIILDRTEVLRKRNAELREAENILKEKNEELKKINNRLSSFAQIASHDLQEPLRKIQTYSTLLFDLDGGKLSEKGKELHRRMYESSERMRNLIQDLLTYSSSDDKDSKVEDVDLNLLVQEVVNELEVKFIEKKATIDIGELPCLNGVRFQLNQLFLNLLSNALKFSKANNNPHIVVRAAMVNGNDVLHEFDGIDKRYYYISVSDNGIGFPPQYSDKIFEMFHRLHRRSEYEGTGIGLAICRKIVENHKGAIFAEGREGEGAVFHIYLPVIECEK